MSGGHYNYGYRHVEEFIEQLIVEQGPEDEYIDPYVDYGLRQRFREHLNKVSAAMRAIEWNDSGDGARREKDLIRACLEPAPEQEQEEHDEPGHGGHGPA